MDTNLVLPDGPDACRVVFDFYFAECEGDAAKEFIARSVAVADQIQGEDVGICEDVQRGLASGSYVAGRLNPLRENAVHHFQELLRAAYRDADHCS